MQDFVIRKAKDDEPEVKQPPGSGVVPETHFRWICSGPSKSGKSNLCKYSLDHFYAGTNGKGSWFDEIYLLSPTAHIDFLWSNLKGLDAKNRISKPTPKHLEHILEKQIKSIAGSTSETALKNVSSSTLARRKENAKNILIIFDDAIAESQLIRSSIFLKLFIQGRHYGISSMVLTQSLMLVPRSVRLQATHLSLFPSRSSEVDRVYNEFGPRAMNRKEFAEMVEFATNPVPGDMYPFLHISAFHPEKTRYRRNFTHTLSINTKLDNPVLSPPVETKSKDTGNPRKRNIQEIL